MSEFYESTPATRLFEDGNICLAGSRERNPETREWTSSEVILWTNYYFDDKSFAIRIMDDETREYLLETTLHDYDSVKAVIEQIAADYPDSFDVKALLAPVKTFFKASPGIVVHNGQVADFEGSCDQCGDSSSDTFNLLYVPAVPGTKLKEASLGFHWNYGCYGGDEIAGTCENNAEEVRTLMTRMLDLADNQFKEDIQTVIADFDSITAPTEGK